MLRASRTQQWFTRASAIFAAAIFILQPYSALANSAGGAPVPHAPSLNLGSGSANIILDSSVLHGTNAVTINVGGHHETFTGGSAVTSGEFLAIRQILTGGLQSLVLNANGTAVGGWFVMNALSSKVNDLVIPTGVTGVDYSTADSGKIILGGSLINQGIVRGVAPIGATITLQAFNDIINSGKIASCAGLTLATTYGGVFNVSNSGTFTPVIKAVQSLNLLIGNGNLTNAGLIGSVKGDLNISTAGDLTVTGTGGTFQALNGNINIRDASYNGAGNTTLIGGDYLSKNLNIYSGSGDIEANVGNVSGQLNSYAGIEHFTAASQTLVLGDNNIAGDPTFVNSGNITIKGLNVFAEDVAIIANGNILADVSGAIKASGHNILLLAGVSPTGGAPLTSTIKQSPATGITATSATVDFTSTSNKGGNVDFTKDGAATILDTSSGTADGGNITIAAFAKPTTNAGGKVLLNTKNVVGSLINASSYEAGDSGGNITIIAGAKTTSTRTITTSINLGTGLKATRLVTTGGGGSDIVGPGTGGNIEIDTAQPKSSSGNTITFDTHGNSGGTSVVSSASVSGNVITGTFANASVVLGDVATGGGSGVASSNIAGQGGSGGNAGNITINAGNSITAGNVFAFGGGGAGGACGDGGINNGGTGGPGGNGGNVSLNALLSNGIVLGSVTVNGSVNTSGGGGGGGGGGGANVSGGSGGAGGAGGSAGTISVPAVQLPATVTITGSILCAAGAAGGSGGAGSTTSGAAGGGGGGGGASFGGGGGGGGGGSTSSAGHNAFGGGGGAGFFGGGGGGGGNHDLNAGGGGGAYLIGGASGTDDDLANPGSVGGTGASQIGGTGGTYTGSGGGAGGTFDSITGLPGGGGGGSSPLASQGAAGAAVTETTGGGTIHLQGSALRLQTTRNALLYGGAVQLSSVGALALNSNVYGSTSVSLTAGGITQVVISTVFTPSLSLSPTGTSAAVLSSDAGIINVNTTGGSATVRDTNTSPITINSSGTPTIVAVTSAGSITLGSALQATTVQLIAGNTIGNSINTGGNTITATSITLHATHGNITTDNLNFTNLELEAAPFSGIISLNSNTLTASPDSTTGNGGSITLTGNSITYTNSGTNPLTINANGNSSLGTGVGNGGSITVILNAGTPITIGTAAGNFALNATSGLTGGNGGTIAFSTPGATLSLATNAGSGVPLGIANGPQGTNGDGGSLALVANSITWTSVGTNALVLNGNGGGASGTGTGKGGAITVRTLGASTLTIGTAAGDFQVSSTGGGNGGGGGSLSVLANAVFIEASGSLPTGLNLAPVTGKGGSLSITSNTLDWTASATSDLILNMSSGSGAGGSINISISPGPASTTKIGNSAGQLSLIANGSGSNADGGSITFASDGVLFFETQPSAGSPTASPTGLQITPGSGGKGGTLNITAASLDWDVRGTEGVPSSGTGLRLDASSQNGSGGSVSLTLTNPSAAPNNNGGLGSKVALGQGPADILITAIGFSPTGNGGSATVSVPSQVIIDNNGIQVTGVNTSGPIPTAGNGGNITIQADSLLNDSTAVTVLNASTVTGTNFKTVGNAGTVDIELTGTGTLTLGNSPVGFQLLAMGGQSKGNGGHITVNAPNMTIDFLNNTAFPAPNVDVRGASGNAGSLSITGSNFTWNNSAATALVLRANPVGTKSTAGSISISVDDPTGVSVGLKPGQMNLVTTKGFLGVANNGGDLTVASKLSAYSAITLQALNNLNINAAVGSSSTTGNINLTATTGSVNVNAPVGSTSTQNVNITGGNGVIQGSQSDVVSGVNGNINGGAGGIYATNAFLATLDFFVRMLFMAAETGALADLFNKSPGDPRIVSAIAGTALTIKSAGPLDGASPSSAIAAPSIFLSAPKIGTVVPVNINNEFFGTYLLGVKSAGAVVLHNIGTPVPQLVNISTNSFTMTSDGDIAIGAANVGKSSALINLTSLGNINNSGAGVNLVGKLVTLSTPYGSIGNNASVSVSGALATYSLLSQNIFSIAKTATLQDLTALDGSIAVQTATSTSTLSVAAGGCVLANNGGIILENDNTTTGKFVASLNSMIETTGPFGGGIFASLGSATAVAGTAPVKNINVNNIGGNTVFWGPNSITTSAPVNNIILDGQDVIFDTGGLPTSAIRLGGNVTIMTDPASPTKLHPIGSRSFAGDDIIVDADSDAL